MMYDHWGFGSGMWFWFGAGPISILALFALLPLWIIFTKAGLPGWLAFLILVSGVNVLTLYYFAFTEWPALTKDRPGSDGRLAR
jgi:hypothetical protein